MRDHQGGMIELIEGEWMPHVALTIHQTRAENDIWAEWVQRVGDPVAYKESGGLKIFYFKDPSGNYVEVVNEK